MLLERERELERIDAALESVCAGTGAVIVIEAEAGIGKTALVTVARERAHGRGMAVLDARGTELEAAYPFGVVRQCVEPVLRAAGERDRERLLSGAAALAAPVLIDAPAGGEVASFGVLHGLYWLLANLAEHGPLLLAVDDAQWVDEPSLRFLAYLARRVESLPAALLVATRPIIHDDEQQGVLAGLLADPVCQLLAPLALGEAAVAQLLGESDDAGTVDAAFSRACQHATGGNPFLLRELTRTLREQGVAFSAAGAERVGEITPPEVARAARARLARLDAPARDLGRAVAVLGDDAPLDLACELAGLDPIAATQGAEELLRAGLLEPGRLLRFRHPLLRAGVAASVTPFERDAWHRKAAALLRARGAAPERIAVHLLATASGLDEAAVLTLREAAIRAVEQGAPGAAVLRLRRALEEPLDPAARAELLLFLGRAERTAGQRTAASEHLREAARLTADPAARAQALIALKHALGPGEEENRSFALLADAALEDSNALDRELALKLKAALFSALYLAGIEAGHRQTEITEEFARLTGDTVGECVALAQLVELLTHGEANAAQLGALAERATRNADALLEAGAWVSWVHSVALALRWTDRMDAAERFGAKWVQTARREGSVDSFGAAHTHSSNLNRMRGRLRESEADAAIAVATAVPGDVPHVMSNVALACCLLSKGDVAAAEAAYAATGLGAQIPPIRPYVGALLTRADLRAARGEHAQALADFDEASRRTDGLRTGQLLGDRLVAIECHHALGDKTTIADMLEETLKLASWWGTDSAIGSVLRVRGRLAADSTAAIEDLRSAIEHLERSPRRLEHACALVDLGAALRRARQRSNSREPLRAGYELARECGADGLAETARQELAASGVRVRRERLTGAESLTPSERRIAEMAAEGASNAEIAQALFVTVKTVEMHLTHVYRKLDITRRAELARALGHTGA